MCGHGTIGMVTFGLEHGLIAPREPGRLKAEVPAGLIDIDYAVDGDKVVSVTIRNVPAYLAAEGDALLACVGSYRLEGPGAQLFEAVEGDYFTVLGLPLWPVLAELRRAGVLRP